MPSREKKLCTPEEGVLRGSSVSSTIVRLRERPSTSAALNPAEDPPTTTTS
jgi:hypothetical protein